MTKQIQVVAGDVAGHLAIGGAHITVASRIALRAVFAHQPRPDQLDEQGFKSQATGDQRAKVTSRQNRAVFTRAAGAGRPACRTRTHEVACCCQMTAGLDDKPVANDQGLIAVNVDQACDLLLLQ